MASSASLLFKKAGNAAIVTLNRPKALNALSLEMVCEMRDHLVNWRRNQDIGLLVMKGEGGKAFCAGGDVKLIWQEVRDLRAQKSKSLGTGRKGLLSADFFREEYHMNYLLGSAVIPQVSLWDGIVMGGGVGISVLGKYRVATEKTVFAMPETAIGLFPDVGSSSWLPHLPHGYGRYIGLTGARLHAADLLAAGIATHYVSSDKLEQLEKTLAEECPADFHAASAKAEEILSKFSKDSSAPDQSKSVLLPNQENIKNCFEESPTTKTMEHIIFNLQELSEQKNAWAAQTLSTLEKMSPTSMKLTLAQIAAGKTLQLDDCLQMEFRLVQGCMRHLDFEEGIRALLVDKDNSPNWCRPTLETVRETYIREFFTPLGENDLNLKPYKEI